MREFIKVDEKKGRVEFLDSRFYQDPNTGNFYPSVTTILDAYPKTAAYYEWIKKHGQDADEIRDEAGRKGSVIHQVCEDYDRGIEISFVDSYGNPKFKQIEWAMFERYVEFRTKFPMELIANELHYISLLFGWGGTLDRAFRYQNLNWLIDIKTGNQIYDHHWPQLAAYAAMFEEHNNMQIDKIAILHLNAKTKTEGSSKAIQGIGWKLQEPEYSREHYFGEMQATKLLWDSINRNMKPRNLSYKLTHKFEYNGKQSS